MLQEVQGAFHALEGAGGILAATGGWVLWKLSGLRTDGGDWHTQLLPGGRYSAPVETRRRSAARLVVIGGAFSAVGLAGAELIELVLTLTGSIEPPRWNPQPLRAFVAGSAVLAITASPFVVLVRQRERHSPLERPSGLYPPWGDLTLRGRRHRAVAGALGGAAAALFMLGVLIQALWAASLR